MAAEKNQDPSFEEAMENLEKIVGEMESDTLPLERLLVRYEEGLKLVKICGDKLEAAERKIEMIARTAGGKVRGVEFPPAASPAGPAPSTPPSTPPAGSATEKDSAGTKTPAKDVRLF